MTGDKWIWIERWPEFQHYAPERDRPPAWIKTYPKQLLDDAYLELTPRQRALLNDLRMAFALSRFCLEAAPYRLTNRLAYDVRTSHLTPLIQAGFIAICSRATLDRRLEELYSRSRAPRARPRGREEGEVEDQPLKVGPSTNRSTGAAAPQKATPPPVEGIGRKPREPDGNNEPTPTRYEQATELVRNALWQDPHRRDHLHQDFPDLTPKQLDQLDQLADQYSQLADKGML